MDRRRQFTLRELFGSIRYGRHMVAYLIATAILAYLGPFSTYERMTAGERVLYWASVNLANWIFTFAFILIAIWLLQRRGTPRIASVVAGCIAATVPNTAVVYAAEIIIKESVLAHVSLAGLYLSVLVITLMLGLLVVFLTEQKNLLSSPYPEGLQSLEGVDNEKQPVPFLRRLPEILGPNLICLRMRDHYVEAHTVLGQDLILMRFSDALDELGNADGAQVHRSWWVARQAIASHRRENNRLILTLTDGQEVPVSRSHASRLKRQGWFQ